MTTPTPEEIAALIASQVRAAHPHAPRATLARLLRAEWVYGLERLDEVLLEVTAEARAAERERARVAAVRAAWSEAAALLDHPGERRAA